MLVSTEGGGVCHSKSDFMNTTTWNYDATVMNDNCMKIEIHSLGDKTVTTKNSQVCSSLILHQNMPTRKTVDGVYCGNSV